MHDLKVLLEINLFAGKIHHKAITIQESCIIIYIHQLSTLKAAITTNFLYIFSPRYDATFSSLSIKVLRNTYALGVQVGKYGSCQLKTTPSNLNLAVFLTSFRT